LRSEIIFSTSLYENGKLIKIHLFHQRGEKHTKSRKMGRMVSTIKMAKMTTYAVIVMDRKVMAYQNMNTSM